MIAKDDSTKENLQMPVKRKPTFNKRFDSASHNSNQASISDDFDPYVCFYCEALYNSSEHVQRHLRGSHKDEKTLLYFRKSQPEKTFRVERR